MLKLTVDPDPGYAVKELFFTYNPVQNNLYAIFPKYPDNKKLVINNTSLPIGTKISFLSTHEELVWRQNGTDVEISLPEFNPNKIKSPYAFAVKIENFGRYASKPQIKVDYNSGDLKPTVTFSSDKGTEIRYTVDGSDPGPNSTLYTEPVAINKNSLVKAYAFFKTNSDKSLPSSVAYEEVKVYRWMNAVKTSGRAKGINYRYYQPEGNVDIGSINGKPDETGVTDNISITRKKRKDKFAFDFSGYLKIENDGIYTFYLESDDGSQLLIDDEEIVNNGGYHGAVEKTGRAALKKGYHKIHVLYFDAGGDNSLRLSIQPEGGVKEQIPASNLFH